MTKPAAVFIITDPTPADFKPGMGLVGTILTAEDHALVAQQIGSSQLFKEDIAAGRRLYLQPITKAQVTLCMN